MKTKLTILAITITVLAVMGVRLTGNKQDGKMATIKFSNELGTKISPTGIPTPSIKEFKYNTSTDLEMELEKINPQVLDSDFE